MLEGERPVCIKTTGPTRARAPSLIISYNMGGPIRGSQACSVFLMATSVKCVTLVHLFTKYSPICYPFSGLVGGRSEKPRNMVWHDACTYFSIRYLFSHIWWAFKFKPYFFIITHFYTAQKEFHVHQSIFQPENFSTIIVWSLGVDWSRYRSHSLSLIVIGDKDCHSL